MSGERPTATRYAVAMTAAAHRVYKKLDPPVQRRIKAEMDRVVANPYAAPLLHGLPLPIRSHHFTVQGVHWRLAYTLDEANAKLAVVLLGVRENFYERLKRLL